MKDPFKPDNDKFKPGDLVRYTDPKRPNQPSFWRVARVHQAWLEPTPAKRIGSGPMKLDCELVNRPSENDEGFGFVALPESQIEALWHLAVVAGEPSAEALADELERIRTTWPTEDEDCD